MIRKDHLVEFTLFVTDASSIPTCLILLDELLDCPVAVQRKEMGKLVQVIQR